MPETPTDLNSHWHSPTSRWDWFFLSAFGLGLLFSLFSFGVVEPWSELVVMVGAFGLLVVVALRSWLDPEFRFVRTWTMWPLVAVFVLIVLQILPLPTSLVGTISPASQELRETLIGDGQQAASGTSTISLNSVETRHDLRMALVFAAVFFTSASVFRTQQQIKRALWCIFIVGCVESAIALLQILTLSYSIHWMFAERSTVVTSGSFVNHSHFCQFVNLSLGAGVALVLVRMKEDSRRERGRASRLADLRGDRYLRPLTGVVLCVVAVCTSMSRNGVLSLLIASAFCGGLIYYRGVLSARGWLFGAVPWLVATLLFLTSFDTIYERFASLEDRQAIDDRWQLTSGTLQAWLDFPLLGSGLGTHEYLFPMYDQTNSSRIAEHADNDWAQLLEEFGLLGAGAVLAFVGGIFWTAGRLMLYGRTSLSTAAFGLCFGLLAAGWHSLSDFGQHLPGIFMLTAMVSGLTVALARYERNKTQRSPGPARANETEPDGRPWGVVGVLACLVVTLCGWWALSGAYAANRADSWARIALGFEQRLEAQDWLGSDQEYVDLLVTAEEAVHAEPANVKNGYLLNFYRWRSLSRQRDESGSVVLSSEALPYVERIVDELAALRVLCPVYGPVYGLEGELRLQVLGEEFGADLIRQAGKLTPHHAPTNLLAGRLAELEGRSAEAKAFFERTIEVQPHLFRAVADVCLGELNRPALVVELAGNDFKRLWVLAELMRSAEQQDDGFDYLGQAAKLRAEAIRLLRARVETGEAKASEVYRLAEIEMKAGQSEVSIQLIRQALKLDYGQQHWRLALSRALLKVGKPEQAVREAKILLRLNPESKAAAQIVKQADRKL